MQIKSILITDGGPHPADKVAEATAGLIADLIQLELNATEGTSLAKKKFEVAVMEAMLKAHKDAQLHERISLHDKQDKQLDHDCDPMEFAKPAFDAVIAATKGTVFEPHFQLEHVQSVVMQTILNDIGTSMHTERSWHVDGKHISRRTGKHEPRRGFNPNSKERQAWLARHRTEEADVSTKH